MERHFLLYLIYIVLIEIRERGNEINDKTIFGLCDLLHNVPLQLTTEEGAESAYKRIIEKVEYLGIQNWLDAKKEEFCDRYPEYKKFID